MAVQHTHHDASDAGTDSAHAGALAGAALAMLDRLKRGVLLLDMDARILHLNEPARGMVSRGDAVSVVAGRLVLHSSSGQRRFLEFLRRKPSGGDSQCPPSLTFSIPTDTPHRSYSAQITPLPRAVSEFSQAVSHCAVVYEPHASQVLPESVLIDLYGLTRREAALAARLFAGGGLDDAAQGLEMSVHTARTHLKRIFIKCDVRTQAELLQLLALGPRTM